MSYNTRDLIQFRLLKITMFNAVYLNEPFMFLNNTCVFLFISDIFKTTDVKTKNSSKILATLVGIWLIFLQNICEKSSTDLCHADRIR